MTDNPSDSSGVLDEPTLNNHEINRFIDYLGDYGDELLFDSEEIIVNYGDVTTSIDLLISGEALVEVPANGKWIPVAWIKEGSVIGEIAFLDSHPRTARVIARTECRLFRIDKAVSYTHLTLPTICSV